MGDVDASVHIHRATALGRGPMLGCLYPRESLKYSFYIRLSGPQDQSGHKGATILIGNIKKSNLHWVILGQINTMVKENLPYHIRFS